MHAHTVASMSNDDSNDTYTIILRGESLSITRAQIEADSPGANFFASSLLGDFMEASHRAITLDRHPGIFKIILDHLSGYTILPLDEEYVEGVCGREMTTQRAMRFLSDDADYYGFTRLKEMLNEEVNRQNDEKSKQEAKEAKAINVEKRRLELEETRLKMDLKKVVRANQRAVNERRLKLLQIELKCQLGQLQAAATFAASRQVGAASYGVSLIHNKCSLSLESDNISTKSVIKGY